MSEGCACYSVCLVADSPVHIGWHDLGFVQRTRYYIPARNIWGALVARLAPFLAPEKQVEEMYEYTQRCVNESLRATYFFPAAGCGDDSRLWRPDLGDGAWERECERFLSCQTAAALDPSRLSAEEGALHESEFLSPRNRDGAPLYFRGYVLLRGEKITAERVRQALDGCTVGADRRYGWGRLRLAAWAAAADSIFADFTLKGWPENDTDPTLICRTNGAALPAHVICSNGTARFQGELEPVAGREWAPHRGSGQRISTAEICWTPGSIITGDAAIKFRMKDRGLWEAQDPRCEAADASSVH